MDSLALESMRKLALEKPDIPWIQPAKASANSRNARQELHDQLSALTAAVNGECTMESSDHHGGQPASAVSGEEQGSHSNDDRVPAEENPQPLQPQYEQTDGSSSSGGAEESCASTHTANPAAVQPNGVSDPTSPGTTRRTWVCELRDPPVPIHA